MARNGNLRRLVGEDAGLQAALERAQAASAANAATDKALGAQLAGAVDSMPFHVPDYLAGDYPGAEGDAPLVGPEAEPIPARPARPTPAPAQRSAFADADLTDPMLQKLVSGAGGVADRAQAAMQGGAPMPVAGGATPARKPLVSPEVAAFVAKQTGTELPTPDTDALAAAKKAAGLNDTLASLTDQLEIANGKYDAGRSARLHANAQQPVTDEQAKQDQVRAFVEKKLGLERQARQDQRQSEMDALNTRNIESQIATRERGRQPAPVDPLDAEKKRAEIAKLEAETDRLKRRGGGAVGPKPPDEMRQLQIEKLRQQISGEDPRKVASAESSAQRMKGLIAELRRIHSGGINPETGQREEGVGTELTGPASEKMSQLMTQIRIEAKNLAELGALSGPDYALMEKMTGQDPSGLWANIKGTFGVDNTDTNLNGLEKWADNAAQSARDVYGSHGAQGSDGGGQIRVSNGSESYLIDPSDLADAERDGFKRVN